MRARMLAAFHGGDKDDPMNIHNAAAGELGLTIIAIVICFSVLGTMGSYVQDTRRT